MFSKDDVAKHRCVAGEMVPLTDAERQAIADEWNNEAVAQAALRSAVALATKRREALDALADLALERALSDPNAPEAVKAYGAALNAAARNG